MSSTKRYQLLRRELFKAKRAFLPATFDPLGNYSELQSDRARGFLLVAHAEIESFIEDRVRDTAQTSVDLWRSKQKTTRALASLLTYIFLEEGEPRWKNLDHRIHYAHNKFNISVRDNNGVKSDNLKRLLMPVGQDIDVLDPLFLTEIDSFGESRGSAAHSSNWQSTGRTVFDPKLECERVFDKLLPHLKSLDEALRNLAK